jgi:hypothetical protein
MKLVDSLNMIPLTKIYFYCDETLKEEIEASDRCCFLRHPPSGGYIQEEKLHQVAEKMIKFRAFDK